MPSTLPTPDLSLTPHAILDRLSAAPMAAWLTQLLAIALCIGAAAGLGAALNRRAAGTAALGQRPVLLAFLRQVGPPALCALLLGLGVAVVTAVQGDRAPVWWLEHALAIALAIAAVRLAGWALRIAMRPHDLLAFTLWLLEWALVAGLALAFLGLWQPLVDAIDRIRFEVGSQVFKGQNILGGILLAAAAFTLATQALRLINAGIARYARSQALDNNHGLLLFRLLAVALFILTAVGVLISSGIEGATLAAFAGALGLGLGFGLQEVVINFVAGLYILIERAMKVGDHVSLNGISGRVTRLSSRAVVVRDALGTDNLIPNSFVTKGVLQNHTLSNDDFRICFSLDIAAAQDFERARTVILEVLKAHPRSLAEQPQRVLITRLRRHAVTLEVSCWINDLHNSTAVMISDLNHSIALALLAHDIPLASVEPA